MKKIGLSQRVEISSETNERRDCLDQRWTTFIQALGYIPVPLSNATNEIGGYLNALDLDGAVLTGGNDIAGQQNAINTASERDRFEAALAVYCETSQIPLLGVCRGLQMINVLHGGRLSRIEGHAGTRHLVRPSAESQNPFNDKFEVNSYHNFAVLEGCLGDGLIPLLLTDGDQVESFRDKSGRQLAIMWHPERETPYSERDVVLLKSFFEGKL